MAVAIQELWDQYGHKATWYEVDTDTAPELRQQFMITTVPTLILFRDGEIAARSEAATLAEVRPVLAAWLD